MCLKQGKDTQHMRRHHELTRDSEGKVGEGSVHDEFSLSHTHTFDTYAYTHVPQIAGSTTTSLFPYISVCPFLCNLLKVVWQEMGLK